MPATSSVAPARAPSIDYARAQRRLGVDVDGDFGQVSWAALLVRVAGHAVPLGLELGRALATYVPAAAIDATPACLAGFVGECCHESWGFTRLREAWGPTAAQRGYEGRRDLGNLHAGDGKRFLGRGLIDVTGRDNYVLAGAALGIDLIAHPERAEEPEIAVRTAINFWTRHGLAAAANRCDWAALTRAINGGLTALDERVRCIDRALAVLG